MFEQSALLSRSVGLPNPRCRLPTPLVLEHLHGRGAVPSETVFGIRKYLNFPLELFLECPPTRIAPRDGQRSPCPTSSSAPRSLSCVNAEIELCHSTRLIYCLVAVCRTVTTNTHKFEILSDRPHATAVRCLGRMNPIYLSTKVDPRKPSCAVEIIVEESTCMLRNATKESSL